MGNTVRHIIANSSCTPDEKIQLNVKVDVLEDLIKMHLNNMAAYALESKELRSRNGELSQEIDHLKSEIEAIKSDKARDLKIDKELRERRAKLEKM